MKARILLAALRSSDASQSSSFTKSLVPAERSLRKLACAWGSFESEATSRPDPTGSQVFEYEGDEILGTVAHRGDARYRLVEQQASDDFWICTARDGRQCLERQTQGAHAPDTACGGGTAFRAAARTDEGRLGRECVSKGDAGRTRSH